jgi:hypothetical protein
MMAMSAELLVGMLALPAMVATADPPTRRSGQGRSDRIPTKSNGSALQGKKDPATGSGGVILGIGPGPASHFSVTDKGIHFWRGKMLGCSLVWIIWAWAVDGAPRSWAVGGTP